MSLKEDIKKRVEMKKAFTLIEVLIVVLIIGILTSLAIPAYEGIKIKAKFGQMFADIGRLEHVIDYRIVEQGWTETGIVWEFYDVVNDELGSSEFGYTLGWIKQNGKVIVFSINVEVGGTALCRRFINNGPGMHNKGPREWLLNTNHPWHKYLRGLLQDPITEFAF